MSGAQRRKGHISAAKRLITSIEIDLEEVVIDQDVLSAKIDNLKIQKSAIDKYNEEIQQSLSDDDAITKDITDASDLNLLIYYYIKQTEHVLSSFANIETSKVILDRATKFLPLKLSTFDGKYHDWQHFWDTFEAGVDSRSELSGSQKIMGQLEGEERRLLGSFSMNNSSCNEAASLPGEADGRPERVAVSHLDALLDIGPPSHNVHVADQRNLQGHESHVARSLIGKQEHCKVAKTLHDKSLSILKNYKVTLTLHDDVMKNKLERKLIEIFDSSEIYDDDLIFGLRLDAPIIQQIENLKDFLTQVYYKKRRNRCIQLVQGLWHRWKNKYLDSLRPRKGSEFLGLAM